jgi:sugar lactone lactonase YvrE
MKLSDFKLTAKDFGTFGQGLQNPECVWVDRDGIWASDLRGGVARVTANADGELLGSGIGQPNGFSRRPDGSFVVAGIGDSKLYRIAPNGATRMLLDSFDGKPLGAVNYACADGPDRIWMSVMTRHPQWHDALTTQHGDGYILRIEDNGARCEIVADGLDLTNEVKVSPDGQFLYAAETMGCRVVRFPIRRDGSLGPKEPVGPASLGRDALPDGITLDAMGNVWVTIINQNGLFVIDKHGDVHIVYRDMNKEAVATLAANTDRRASTVDELVACSVTDGPVRLPTSIAFGPDGRTVYVGTLTLPHLATFQLPKDLS